MKRISHHLVEFFKWDLRGILATVVALAVIIGFSVAATGSALFTFDFGTASVSDLASGALQVRGALSVFPQVNEQISYGWQNTSVQEFSDKSVSNKLNMDYNGAAAGSDNTFAVGSLEPGTYRFRFTVGSAVGELSTRVQIGSKAITIATNNTWKTGEIVHTTNGGIVEIGFSSGDGVASWGVSSLMIYSEADEAPESGFEMSITPSKQRVEAGGVATYNVGLTSVNYYANSVELKISGLVQGLTAELVPPVLTSLPATSELRISTSASSLPLTYDLLVVATGASADPVIKTGVVQIEISSVATQPNQPDGGTDDPTTGTPDGGTDSPGVVGPDGSSTDTRTEEDLRNEFALIDEFAAEEQRKLLQQQEFVEIGEIGDTLDPIPIYERFPEPETAFEGVLQGLVQKGIIQSTVDVARPSEPAEGVGFWERFMKTLFPPVE